MRMLKNISETMAHLLNKKYFSFLHQNNCKNHSLVSYEKIKYLNIDINSFNIVLKYFVE
jgi:hypothetical protein